MIRPIVVLGLVAALAACSPKEAAKAPEPAPAPAPAAPAWAGLDALAGKYPSDSGLFETSVLTPDLKALLGDRFETFQVNMQVETPLKRDPSGVFYTSGNKPHDGGINAAYLMVDPARTALEVGLWEKHALTIYKSGPAITKPKDIETTIDNAANMQP